MADKIDYTTASGHEVRVGHCTERYNCKESICIGTNCQKYEYINKNKPIQKKT